MAKASSSNTEDGIIIYPTAKYSTNSNRYSSSSSSSSTNMSDLTTANQIKSILTALDVLTRKVNEMDSEEYVKTEIRNLYKRILGSNYAKYNNLTDISTKLDLNDDEISKIKEQIRKLFDLIGNDNYGLTAEVKKNTKAIEDLDDTIKYCKSFDPNSAKDNKIYMVDEG